MIARTEVAQVVVWRQSKVFYYAVPAGIVTALIRGAEPVTPSCSHGTESM